MDKEFFKADNKIFDFKLRPITFLVYCYLLKCNNAENCDTLIASKTSLQLVF